MDLRDLRLFLHLSRTLHFARSSAELHISPSGLTRAIQRLESELAIELFERDKRKVKLTHAGSILREFARETTDRMDTLRDELGGGGRLTGALSLFCSVTASYSFLHELLQRFRSQFPFIELQLHTGDSARALARVLDEMEELAIAALPDRLPDQLAFLPLGESPLVCIGPAVDCPIRTETARCAGAGRYDWAALPFILPETGLARQRIDQWFGARALTPKVYAQVSGHEAMVSMVGLGCGIAVVPRVVVDNSPMREVIEILPVMQELQPFKIGLCALQRKFASPLVRAFWSIAEDCGGNYTAGTSVYNQPTSLPAGAGEEG
jgi:LysR family transcriptional regulator, positive regulator for ilvC